MPFYCKCRLAQSLLLFILLPVSLLCSADDTNSARDMVFVAKFDKSQQKYALLLPLNFKQKKSYDILIALHGHGSDRWQFMKSPRPECKATRDVAAKFNMILVTPDYRAKTSWMGPAATADLKQIISELKQKYSVQQVFLCGASMGGASSLTFAVLHPELLDGVASMNGTANHLEYENFQIAIQKSFGGTKSKIPQEYKKRSAEYWPENFSMPVAFAVGGQDKSVPPDSVLRLSKVLKNMDRTRLLIYREQGGHSTNYKDATAILEFIIEKANNRQKAKGSFLSR